MEQTNHSHYLSDDQREFIFYLHQSGYSYSSIKREFETRYGRKIYNSTISDICNKVNTTGSVKDLNKSGRPPVYDERESRNIIRASLSDRTKSIRDIVSDPDINPKEATFETVRTLFTSHRIVSRVLPKRMQDLSRQNIKDRVAFADQYFKWEVSDWELVIFSDEADLFPIKCGKEYIRLREEEKLVDVVPIREGSKKNLTVKVWGSISSLGVGPLVRYEETMKAQKYVDTLNTYLLQEYPMLENSKMEEEGQDDQLPTFSFVHDNCTPHTAKIVKNWRDENQVNFLKWPSNSPDLNIIENVWAYLQDKLYEVRAELTCPDDTWEKTLEIWRSIPLTYIQDLYQDLPLRIGELKIMKGGPIPH